MGQPRGLNQKKNLHSGDNGPNFLGREGIFFLGPATSRVQKFRNLIHESNVSLEDSICFSNFFNQKFDSEIQCFLRGFNFFSNCPLVSQNHILLVLPPAPGARA